MLEFKIRSTSAGRKYGGHYLEPWCLTAPFSKFLIGHKDSDNYTRGQFLILPKKLICGDYLVASNDEKLLKKIQDLILNDRNFSEALKQLMIKNYAHLSLAREVHVGGPFLLRKVHCLRFVCLPKEIGKDPVRIKEYLDGIRVIADCLGITALN